MVKKGLEILPARRSEEAKNTKKTTIDVEDEAEEVDENLKIES